MILDLNSRNLGHRRHAMNCIAKIAIDGVAFPHDARIVYVDTDRRIVRRWKVDQDGNPVVEKGAWVIEELPIAAWVKLEIRVKPTCRCSPEDLKP
jgi:hypothetical protein